MSKPSNNHQSASVIAVVGACGGIGTTAFTVASGYAMRYKKPTVLIDLETGSGLETSLGLEKHDGLRWARLQSARGLVSIDEVVGLLPTYAQIPVLLAGLFENAAPQSEAIDAILTSMNQTNTQALAHVDRAKLYEFRNHWAAIIVVAPLTVQGASNALTLQSLIENIPTVLVTTDLLTPEITAKQLEKTLNKPIAGHIKKNKDIKNAVSLGNGPLGGSSKSQKMLIGVAQQVLEKVRRNV